jgi:hypothetical protein
LVWVNTNPDFLWAFDHPGQAKIEIRVTTR